ncbi:MAG: hypothetical protein AAFR35_16815 [Pseudomonadota bacterium]
MSTEAYAALLGGLSGGALALIGTLISVFITVQLHRSTLQAQEVESGRNQDENEKTREELRKFRVTYDLNFQRTKLETKNAKLRDQFKTMQIIEVQLEPLVTDIVLVKGTAEDFRDGRTEELDELVVSHASFIDDPRPEELTDEVYRLVLNLTRQLRNLQTSWSNLKTLKQLDRTDQTLVDFIEEIDELQSEVADLSEAIKSEKRRLTNELRPTEGGDT